jgi:RNA polymerase sigma-70 factor (ECF subfamily)
MSDETIMEAVKNGDLQQASLLFDRYQKPVFNFLARMTMDREAAEDLTQNVFLRMIKYRNSYREGHKFQSWIYQMARNVFSDHYQKEKNKRAGFVDVGRLSDQIGEGSEDQEQMERERRLIRSLAMLSDEHRELLVLTRFTNLKYEEVATITNMTVANIKVRVHRAIQKLREYYFELESIE